MSVSRDVININRTYSTQTVWNMPTPVYTHD